VSTGVEVQGARTLARTLDNAAAELLDLSDVNDQVARIINAKAATLAPRRTGRLAASLRATSEPGAAVMGSAVPYAPPVHWGVPAKTIKPRPFLTDAVRLTEPQWMGAYTTEVEDIIGKVKGDG